MSLWYRLFCSRRTSTSKNHSYTSTLWRNHLKEKLCWSRWCNEWYKFAKSTVVQLKLKKLQTNSFLCKTFHSIYLFCSGIKYQCSPLLFHSIYLLIHRHGSNERVAAESNSGLCDRLDSIAMYHYPDEHAPRWIQVNFTRYFSFEFM